MLRTLVTLFALGLAPFAASDATAQTKVPSSQVEIALGFAPLVKEAAPAVVNIYAKRLVAVRESPFQGDPFFQNMFRNFGGVRPQVQNSLGSGVILTESGIVVSNYHVVGMATDIRIVLKDRREFTAEVLLADQPSDLAILQIQDAGPLPHLNLRNSDSVEVGELVLAIGNPFGIGQTVSSGIVSGLARSGAAAGVGQGYFIQTDAAINPGNSGGALIDINGDLIGVNTRILTKSGGSDGIGFAIPANLVAEFVSQAQKGHVRFSRPWAGAIGQPVDADIAESLGLDRPGGVLISDLHSLSPFRQAGIGPGDVILAVDGQPVTNGAEMLFRMSVAGLGGTALIEGMIGGRPGRAEVALIAPPEAPARERLTTSANSVLPGVVVSRVNPAVIAELGLPARARGIVVTDPGNLGARVGLLPRDILLAVNQTQIKAPSDVEDALRKIPGRVTMTVLRGSRRVTLRFRL